MKQVDFKQGSSERVSELWMARVVNQRKKIDMTCIGRGESKVDRDEVDGKKQGVAGSTDKVKHIETRMWANAQRDGRPAEYRWHLCLTPQSLADAHYQCRRAVTLRRRETR